MTRRWTSRFARCSVRCVLITFVFLPLVVQAQQDSKSRSLKSLSFKSPIISLSIDGDQKRIFAGSGSTVHVFDAELKPVSKLQTEMAFVCDILCDGKLLYVAGGDPAEHGMVELHELDGDKGFKLLKRKIAHQDVIHSVAKNFAGHLLTASADAKILMHTAKSISLAGVFEHHSKRVTVVESIPGLDLVVSGGLDDTIRVWASDDRTKPIRTLTNHQDDILDIQCFVDDSEDENSPLPMVATVSRDRTVRFWQPTIGRMIRFKKLDRVPSVCCWIPKTRKVLVGCDDGKILEISSQTLEIREIYDLKQPVFSLRTMGSSTVLVGGRNRLVMTNF